MPWSIDIVKALLDVQVNIAACPAVIVRGAAVSVAVGSGVPELVYVTISRGAVAAAPSKLLTNFLEKAPLPVPLRMMDRLFPDCQSARPTTSCTTAFMSSREYQVLAAQLTLSLWLTALTVTVRCDGRVRTVNGLLLPTASAAIEKAHEIHWLCVE